MSHSALLIIPARMASTRLPGKPLADINGVPMIVRVWQRAVAADIGPVYVACDGPEIAAAIEQAGGHAVITDPALPSGTDRIWRAVQEVDSKARYDVVINVQGDQPGLNPDYIAAAAAPLRCSGIDIGTLACPIHDLAEADNPAVVKPVLTAPDANGIHRALYFSRARVPHGDGGYAHHIGLYAFRRAALERFVHLPPSPLEEREKLEQLRALENGMTIGVAMVESSPMSVDTPEDLTRARALLT